MEIKKIAEIKTDFPTKFGIPRQSRRINSLTGEIIFEPEYRSTDYIRGIEQYSHLWLIWGFSENEGREAHSTVRPPRLGGNKRIGVFASRSPFRPNGLGLSCVELKEIRKTDTGAALIVCGADLMDGTPIYDIKPYIPYSDCAENAECGFAQEQKDYRLEVEADKALLDKLPPEKRETLVEILADDPRPAYQNDESRIYGFEFINYEIKFKVSNNTLSLVSVDEKQ